MSRKNCPACGHSIDNHSSTGCQIKGCKCKLKPSQISTGFGNKPARKSPASSKKKDPGEERDGLGFRKKDYPLVGIVALICLNIWAFNVNTTTQTGVIIAVCADLLVALWLWRKYGPKKKEEPTKTTGKSKTAQTGAKKITKAEKEKTEQDNEPGIFGIKKKNYPTMFLALALVITLGAIIQRATIVIIVAAVVDLAVGYWFYQRKKGGH